MGSMTVLFTYLIYCYVLSSVQCIFTLDPEVNMNASELITSKGYPCEEYTVQTKDGFLLGIQRIPHGRNHSSGSRSKGVVFLQHGLLCSSTNWLTNLLNESLAYILADEGYDVWLGNMRGNTYSRRHVKYTDKDPAFWSWSWDEMAAYDLPAMIDFALLRTNASRLHYIGHSQGTLIMFAHLSEHPEFAQKVSLFEALGPVSTVGHMTSPFRYLADFLPELEDWFRLFGVMDFLPNSELFRWLSRFACNVYTDKYCADFLFIIAGFDPKQLNETRLPVYIAHTPAGTSVQNMVHFAQMVNSGKCQKFDYGSAAANQQHYGQATPPEYNLTAIKAPVALFYAENDWLADVRDVHDMIPRLRNLIYSEEIKEWDHLDFVWGLDAATILYPKLITLMEKYNL